MRFLVLASLLGSLVLGARVALALPLAWRCGDALSRTVYASAGVLSLVLLFVIIRALVAAVRS